MSPQSMTTTTQRKPIELPQDTKEEMQSLQNQYYQSNVQELHKKFSIYGQISGEKTKSIHR